MPPTEKDVLAALSELIDPVTGRSFVDSKSVKNVKIDGDACLERAAVGHGVIEAVRRR
jgi:metal-sulfur cluster biosynthetic enzyme